MTREEKDLLLKTSAQGESIDRDKLAKGVLSGVANTIMQFIDANLADGNMCLSNMECEDLENAVRNADWMKVYQYMKKKLEKQGEQKPVEWDNIDNRIQYDSIEAGIKAHAETYSFNIESKLFNQLTKEQQELWREEIEQAVISGGGCGVELAKDMRYKENKFI